MTADIVFPVSYPNADRGQSYADAAFSCTLTEQFTIPGFARLYHETKRDFAGLQLCLYDQYGVFLGMGTGQRVQLPNQPNHADPGYSWHEGVPVEAKTPAFAIDTIGLDETRAVNPGKVWELMERHLPDFGFTSFVQPQPNDAGYWSVVNGRPYLGNWDRPHIQSRYLPLSRNRGAGKGPYTDVKQLPFWPLPHTDLPAKYDIDIVGLTPLDHPLWGAPEDDMTAEQEAKLDAALAAANAALAATARLETALTGPISTRFVDPAGAVLNVPWAVGYSWEYISQNVDRKLAAIMTQLGIA